MQALLLHLAGTDVQDIHSQTQEMRKIKKAVDALNAYFIPKVNTTYARHCFRQLTQAPGETIWQFATRLRWAAKDCGYGADTDNQICDEILCKCTSTYFKPKLLEEGQGLNLDKALQIAENCEKVDTHIEGPGVKGKEEDSANVNRIENKKRGPGKNSQLTCYRCCRSGHLGKDPNCSARGMWIGRTFPRALQDETQTWRRKKKNQAPQGPKGGSLNIVHTQDDEDEPEYAFTVGDKKQ